MTVEVEDEHHTDPIKFVRVAATESARWMAIANIKRKLAPCVNRGNIFDP